MTGSRVVTSLRQRWHRSARGFDRSHTRHLQQRHGRTRLTQGLHTLAQLSSEKCVRRVGAKVVHHVAHPQIEHFPSTENDEGHFCLGLGRRCRPLLVETFTVAEVATETSRLATDTHAAFEHAAAIQCTIRQQEGLLNSRRSIHVQRVRLRVADDHHSSRQLGQRGSRGGNGRLSCRRLRRRWRGQFEYHFFVRDIHGEITCFDGIHPHTKNGYTGNQTHSDGYLTYFAHEGPVLSRTPPCANHALTRRLLDQTEAHFVHCNGDQCTNKQVRRASPRITDDEHRPMPQVEPIGAAADCSQWGRAEHLLQQARRRSHRDHDEYHADHRGSREPSSV